LNRVLIASDSDDLQLEVHGQHVISTFAGKIMLFDSLE
jgi:hypothetical protein